VSVVRQLSAHNVRGTTISGRVSFRNQTRCHRTVGDPADGQHDAHRVPGGSAPGTRVVDLDGAAVLEHHLFVDGRPCPDQGMARAWWTVEAFEDKLRSCGGKPGPSR
jgi:hypothetical protein